MPYRIVICIVGCFSVVVLAQGPTRETFSQKAWVKIAPIYQQIFSHPFNQELRSGTLSQQRFARYQRQDALYLSQFSKALWILSAKIENPIEAQMVRKIAGVDHEQVKVSATRYFSKEMNPSTMLYTGFLLHTAHERSKEELAAVVLPCFWIYLQLATQLKASMKPNAVYYSWVETYSSDGYREAVEFMIALTDRLAGKASFEVQEQMLAGFELASRMEWYFWQSSYENEKWKP